MPRSGPEKGACKPVRIKARRRRRRASPAQVREYEQSFAATIVKRLIQPLKQSDWIQSLDDCTKRARHQFLVHIEPECIRVHCRNSKVLDRVSGMDLLRRFTCDVRPDDTLGHQLVIRRA